MPKRFDRSNPEYRLTAIAAARLRSEGFNQRDIAAQLRKSQPEVSRMLHHAEAQGFLARSPSFLPQKLSLAELGEVDRRFFVPEKLRNALRELAPAGLHLEVRVLPDGDDEFAIAAAFRVVELLRKSKLIGISWGRTVERLVSRISGYPEVFDGVKVPEAQCIPLCGDPVHLINLRLVKYSASHLAAELGQAINPERPSDQPCLAGVPAYLPRRFFAQRGSATTSWQEYVRYIPGHRAIFGPGDNKEKPWVERVDTVITGMGIIAHEHKGQDLRTESGATAAYGEIGDFIRERLAQEQGIDEATLGRLIFGDLDGWLIERPGLSAADRRLVQSLNQGWTGIKGEHLAAVARNARRDGVPGIILVAAGARKAEMVLELVKRGLVNVVLIDSTLARALGYLLGLGDQLFTVPAGAGSRGTNPPARP